MSVDEAKQLADAAAKQITAILQEYEASTGCQIHSVPVDRNDPAKLVEARVKVQLP